MERTLIVLPDDSARPIVDAINHAQKSLRIKWLQCNSRRRVNGNLIPVYAL